MGRCSSGITLAFALSVLSGLGPGSADAQSKPRPSASRAPDLFAFGAALMDANRVECLVIAGGELCSGGTSYFGAGFWPKRTPDTFIFYSGIQLAGMIPPSAGGGRATFPWAGDTVGAYIVDPRGSQIHSEPMTAVFNSRDTADLAAWPNGAVARDPAVFAAPLLGRPAVSEQDLWTRYWDGNPAFLSGRTHPMAVVVDQRVVAWNHPSWNQDIVYFAFTLYNVSARSSAAYANPTIPPEVQTEIAALGARFQDLSEARFGLDIPDGGYAVDSLYVGLFMDADIGEPGGNLSTAVLPLGTALTYQANFVTPGWWVLPAEIYGRPPFAPAPGMVGVTFPRAPAGLGMFNTFTGSATGFPSPVGVAQLWRYLSGSTSPGLGDNPCTVPNSRQRHVCFAAQTPLDTRFSLSHGPFSLSPGQATTIVMAYVFAAPLDTVNAFVGTSVAPGIPFTGDSIAADTSKLRVIDRAAGWLTQADVSGNGIIEGDEVRTTRGSLLFKAQVAQAVVGNKFLMPQAPESPDFFLVPQDDRVTVVWRPSATESAGDPYYAVAADRSSPLYDPNYRQRDVEGYRIYRGRDPRFLELVTQVDHDGTVFADYLGALDYAGQCAPEFGVTTDCAAPFPVTPDTAVKHTVDIRWRMVQVPEDGRIPAANGLVATLRADTFPTGGASGFPELENAGVTFVFEDTGVRNSFRYYYAVTAFDFNSIRSGPASLESPRLVKVVTPRAPSGQEAAGRVEVMRLLGSDGAPLDPAAPLPTIAASTGIFSGPMPPTDGLTVAPLTFLGQLMADGSVVLAVDSVAPGHALGGMPATYFLRVNGPGLQEAVALPMLVDALATDRQAEVRFPAMVLSDSQARRFGGDATYRLYGTARVDVPGTWRTTSWGRADVNLSPPNSAQNGPRWWAGTANENTAGPNELVCTPASGACVQPNLSRNAGALPGVTTVFHLQSYSTVPNVPMRDLEAVGSTVYRAADMRVHWGAGGRIDSVVDVTHRVRVPYHPKLRASWGILTDSSFVLGGTQEQLTADSNNLLLTWSDAFCVDPVPAFLNRCGGNGQGAAVLQDHARLSPVAAQSSTYTGTAALAQTGQGFVVYVNGHFFLMQLALLPVTGTVWSVRFYAGNVTGTRAQGDYAFTPAVRPPAVPGLRAELAYQGSRFNPAVTTDSQLARIHTVPDPFYGVSGYQTSPDTAALKFVHLPARAIIRVYSLSGVLVAAITHDDPTGGGEATWNLRGRTGRRVASGVYFYHIETPDGRRRVGRFTVITR